MDEPKRFSRRAWLKRAIVTGSVLSAHPLLIRSAKAASTPKLAKATVHYRNHPKGRKMCGMCTHFIPPGGTAERGMMGGMDQGMMGTMGPGMMKDGTCQLVQGRITPMGYCVLYVPARS